MSTPRRWIDPSSEATDQIRALLETHDAEPKTVPPWDRGARASSASSQSRRWGGGVAMAAALAGALLFWLSSETAPPASPPAFATVSAADPGVRINGRSLRPGARIGLPAEIDTTGGALSLATQAGDRFELRTPGRFDLRSATHIEVLSGAVEIEAAPRARGGPALVVAARPWRVLVLGTRFSVERVGERDVRVEVERGRVRVAGPNTDKELGAGERFDSRRADAPPIHRQEPIVEDTTREPEVAPRDPPPITPSRARTARRSTRRPLEIDGGPRTATESSLPTAQPDAEATFDVRGRQAELLRQARSADDAATAIARLDEAVALGPPMDHVAAYRAARRTFSEGRLPKAVDRLRALIRRWPTGELTDAAFLDLVRAELLRGDLDAAQAAADDFLSADPAARSRPELTFLRAEIARSKRQWSRGAALYEESARSPSLEAPALFLEALCRAHAGERARAQAGMRRYLERFGDGEFADAARKALVGVFQEDIPARPARASTQDEENSPR